MPGIAKACAKPTSSPAACPRRSPLTLALPARTTSLPRADSMASGVQCAFDPTAVGSPVLTVKLPAARSYKHQHAVALARAPPAAPAQRSYQRRRRLSSCPPALPRPDRRPAAGARQRPHRRRPASTPSSPTCTRAIARGRCRSRFTGKAEAPPFCPCRICPQRPGEHVDLSAVLKHRSRRSSPASTPSRARPTARWPSPTMLGGWANADNHATIDDAGLRAAGGMLKTAVGVDFATPAGTAPNCLFLSHWKQDGAQRRSRSPAAPTASIC